MNTLHKSLIAAGLGLAVLVPAAYAAADDGTPTPVCTIEQRAERQAARDEIRARVVADLAAKGITDPAQIRAAVQAEMTARFGDLPGQGGMGQGRMGQGGMGQGGMGQGRMGQGRMGQAGMGQHDGSGPARGAGYGRG